jgi:nucleoid-associated protein YgaU
MRSRPAQHSHPDRRSWTDLATGLLSLLLVLALVVGIPAALIALRGNPLPDAGTDLGALIEALTRPDDGSLFLAALTWIAWLGWASFALSVAVEALAQVRGLPSPRLPALGPQQRAASALVAAAAVLFAAPLLPAAPASAAGPAPAPVTADTTPAAGRAPDAPGAPASGSTTTMRSSAPAAPTPSLAPRLTHMVQPGDSLWQIAADRLGDGARYREIAQLNYDRVQPDGRTLTYDHWLRPGWQLTLPDAAAAPTSRPMGAVVVKPGDTLWDIAQDQLGDGSRYPEIAAASTDVVQDDGGRLTDPDLIRPGWTLALPGIPAPTDHSPALAPPPTAAPAPAADGAASAAPDRPALPEATGQADRAVGPTARPSEAATPTASPSPAGKDVEQTAGEDAGDLVTVRTAAGVGALLAAGLLGLLAAKRARQQRRRRPGQRIAMPPPDLAPAELDLRLVEDPDALVRVGQALRTLSVLLSEVGRALPPLRLVRLSGQDLELYLAGPGSLPTPFAGTVDPTVWTLSGDAPLLSVHELAAVPSPYPSLVTVGHDLDGAHVLLDLEHVGELAVDGDHDSSVAVLAAIAAELATSTWAEDLQVTLVGCLSALPAALGHGRVRHVATLSELLGALEHRAADVRAALAADGLPDLQHARTTTGQRHGDAWTPEVVLLAGPVPPVDRARLDTILQDLPRVGLAAVITGTDAGADAPSEWTLTLDRTDSGPGATAVLNPLNLALRAQRLTSADLDQLLGLFAVADLPADPDGDPGSASSEAFDEPAVAALGTHLTSDTVTNGHTVIRLVPPAEDILTPPEPDAIELETARTDGAEVIESAATKLVEARSDAVEETAPLPPPPTPHPAGDQVPPLIQVLGPVELLRPRGTIERSKQRQLTEIATYLALHPGLNHAHLSEAIWPGAAAVDNTRNTALSKLRKWMGTDDAGVDYVPRVLDDGYRLHPDVRTDWHLWLELLPDGPQAATTEALASALELVKGKPLAGTNPRRYAWAERHRQIMISAIVDAAHELARRALLDADATLARSAAAVGLQADPGAELLWRDALKAEWLAGDLDGLTNTADRLSALADELGDDLEPDTIELLSELLNRPKGADAR